MTDYKYDAFVSYRHLKEDKLIARRVQTLLEGYKAPGGAECRYTHRIQRLFLDETELTPGGDLSNSIKGALEQSRFLIVVCSEQTKESKWCMQEIEYFKSLHNGRLDRVVTLLVSGNPQAVFPAPLCHETVTERDAEGNEYPVHREVEPLAANVSADTLRGKLKKLKTEYLKLAAALMGCDFDTLFKRHKRRTRKRLSLLAAGTAAVLLLGGLGIHGQYKKAETDRALRLYNQAQAAMSAEEPNVQKSLYYLAESASVPYPREKYQAAAIHATLRHAVLPVESESFRGMILENAVITAAPLQKSYGNTFVSSEFVVACNPKNGRILYHGTAGYLTDRGELISKKRFLTSCSEGRYWIFAAKDTADYGTPFSFTVYDSEKGSSYPLEITPQKNPLATDVENGSLFPAVDVSPRRAAVTCEGLLYLFNFDGSGYRLDKTVSYANNLSSKEAFTNRYWVASEAVVHLSEGNNAVAIEEFSETLVISLSDSRLMAIIPNNGIWVSDFSFSESGDKLLISHGKATNELGGRIELYRYNTSIGRYEAVYSRVTAQAIAQVCFSEEEEVLLARDFTNGVYIAALNSAKLYEDYPVVYMTDKIKAIIGGDGYAFAVSTNDGTVHLINAVTRREELLPVTDDGGYAIQEILPAEDGGLAILSRKALYLTDANGTVEETHYFDSKEYHDYLEQNRQKFQGHFCTYDTAYGNWSHLDFPGSAELEQQVQNKMQEYCTQHQIPFNNDITSFSDRYRLSDNGKTLYVIKNTHPGLFVFDLKDGQTATLSYARAFTADPPKELFLSNSSNHLIIATAARKALVYALPLNGTPPLEIKTATVGELRGAQVDPSGRYLALSIYNTDRFFGTVELWDLKTASLLEVIGNGKTGVAGLCFNQGRLLYGFGKDMGCIRISERGRSKAEYRALKLLTGIVQDEQGNLSYSIAKEAELLPFVAQWGCAVSPTVRIKEESHTALAEELSAKLSGKTAEEKRKIFLENKPAFLDTYSAVKDIILFSNFYGDMIKVTESTVGHAAAKALAEEYCAAVLCHAEKSLYEWNTEDRAAAKTSLYSSVLNVYSQIPEERTLFAAFFKDFSDRCSDSLNASSIPYDKFSVLALTHSTLAELANDGMFLSFVLQGDLDTLEAELKELGFLDITSQDDSSTVTAKKRWRMRLALLKKDPEGAIAAELEIRNAFPEDYEMRLLADWRYFKMLAVTGHLSDKEYNTYRTQFPVLNETRDKALSIY